MSDSYQAIYDAVRSRISGGNIGEVVREATRYAFETSHSQAMIVGQFAVVASEMQRPAVLFRPSLYADGDQWCALYGDDIQSGVCGFGETPEAAMAAFDKAWHDDHTPDKTRQERSDNAQFGVGA
jgi:hypothetical protein